MVQIDDRNMPLYMIGVAARLLGVHPQTLRLYEREGLISPSRTDGNTRLYSQGDIEAIRAIMYLTREEGVNLAGVELIIEMQRRLTQISVEMEGMIERMIRRMESRTSTRIGLVESTSIKESDEKRRDKTVKVKIEKG